MLYATLWAAPTAAAAACTAVPRIDSYIDRPGPARANEKARTFLLDALARQKEHGLLNCLALFLNARDLLLHLLLAPHEKAAT